MCGFPTHVRMILILDLIWRKPFFNKNIFHAAQVITLKFNSASFYGSTACKFRFQVSRKLMKIDLMGVKTLYDCDFFTIPSSVYFDSYSLLLFSHFFANAKFSWQSADLNTFQNSSCGISSDIIIYFKHSICI